MTWASFVVKKGFCVYMRCLFDTGCKKIILVEVEEMWQPKKTDFVQNGKKVDMNA